MKISVDKLCWTKVLLNEKNYQDQESTVENYSLAAYFEISDKLHKLRSFDTGMLIKTSVFRYHASWNSAPIIMKTTIC